jgi:hypothetical protein
MASQSVYHLAQTVRTKLMLEASRNKQDLRRILGHASLFDHLNDELENAGYESGGTQDLVDDETYDEDAEDAENELSYTPCRHGELNQPIVIFKLSY